VKAAARYRVAVVTGFGSRGRQFDAEKILSPKFPLLC
jgi:hypothetical protein